MQTAKSGDTVAIDYVVRTTDGRVVGGTEQNGPQTLTIGKAEIFPEIETQLDGMNVGATETVTIAAENAFGPRREDLLIQIPVNNFAEGEKPEPGMVLTAKQPDGTTVNLNVIDVGEEAVTADANHPLAGEDLHFGLTLVEIKQAA